MACYLLNPLTAEIRMRFFLNILFLFINVSSCSYIMLLFLLFNYQVVIFSSVFLMVFPLFRFWSLRIWYVPCAHACVCVCERERERSQCHLHVITYHIISLISLHVIITCIEFLYSNMYIMPSSYHILISEVILYSYWS